MFQRIILISAVLFSLCISACILGKSVSIKAGLVYKTGAQPVARTKFYLLKEDLEAISEKQPAGAYLTPLVARSLTLAMEKSFQVGIKEEDIKDYIVATAITDFDGTATFRNVPSGTYYLAGLATTRSEDGFVLWSVKIDTDSVKDTIILDQDNAYDSR